MAKKDLVPLNRRTKEEQKAIATKGGIASGKARRKKKDTYELVQVVLGSRVKGDNLKQLKEFAEGLEQDDINVNALMIAGQAKAAVNGNTKAFEVLTEMHNKAQRVQETAQGYRMAITDTTRDFVEAYRQIQAAFATGKWREFIFKGGRGSVKSNFVAAVAEETIYNDPQAHIVFTRRYKTDLRGSVFNQFKKTVIRHSKIDEWDFTASPMQATYKPTGQKVVFVGCDKPISLKSYNFEFGYVKMVINEECDEMAGLEQIDSVEDTFLRNDVNAISVKIYNPPKSANNWMNEYTASAHSREKTFVCHSYYYNVPTDWLGKRFFERAEWFKHNKPVYYANYYLGEITGNGGAVFDNVEFRDITDEEINAQSYFYHGLDWGYQHPQAFVQSAYNSETQTVLITHEFVASRMKQERFAEKIGDYKGVEIIADSANPDKIADYIDFGFNITGAIKRWSNKGRDYSWEWLQTRNKIVVDEKRTPHIARELRMLEFEILKDGTYSSEYPRLEEDAVCALIYSLNRVIKGESYGD